MTDRKWYWVQYFEKAVLEYHPEFTAPNNFQLTPLGALRLKARYPEGVPEAKSLQGENQYHFNETNYTVVGPFLEHWQRNGGIRRFGYPISTTFEEISEADGKSYIVQYFERAVMEYHPEVPPPYDVQLTALGSFRLRELYPNGAPGGASNPLPSKNP